MTNISRRNFLSGSAMAAVLCGLAACGNSGAGAPAADAGSSSDLGLVKEGTLTCIAELGFAPFEFMDEKTGEAKGFDIDIANAIAEKMGLTCEFLPNQKFDTLVPTIKQGGKADIAISGITITDERAKEIDFSEPYIDSNQALVVAAANPGDSTTLNDAAKKVGCQSGTTGEEWIRENLPNATCVPLDDVAAGLAGVQTGLYDGYVIDLPVASNLIKESFTDLEVAEEIPTGEQYGIVVSKDNPALLAAVDKALKDMQDDGTMDKIKSDWFASTI